MSLFAPVTGTAAIHRINPVAKLGAAFLLAGVLILTIDWVSAATALGCEAVLLAFVGVDARTFFLRTAPVWVAAPLAGLTTLLYGQASGDEYWQFGLIHVTDGSIALAIATMLRILAIGLPAIALFITIDPTDLADGLAQVVRLPSRFVLGALAALRLVGLLLEDWRAIGLARRARGVADAGGPLGPLLRVAGQAFALLVLSIRRGSKLATAMEARGFGGPTRRTWARRSTFGLREWAVMAIGAAVAATAVIVSVATGNWNFIGA